MMRRVPGCFAAAALFVGSANAQIAEAPSARCLQDLGDARRWREHKLSCGFDRRSLTYAGTPVEQARCLMRRVPPGGDPVDAIVPLPESLERRIGARLSITRRQAQSWLAGHEIAAEEVGGSLSAPLSRTAAGQGALYFVIHDTSWPEYGPRQFGSELELQGTIVNDLARWREGEASKAHLFISRLGQSVKAVDYGTPWRATRAERCVLGVASRGRFLHNELVQPRRTSGQYHPNDAPPFVATTPAQLHRLALAYVAASVRAGRWLIPAFHAVVDEGLPGGHDDPQGFDMERWAESVEKIASAMDSRRL